jgi:hypothetical protein
VVDIPKVPKQKFEAVIRALVNTPPTPMADRPRKRKPKAKREAGTPKRG